MPVRFRAQTRRDDGAAMVEFAFVGVLLVVLLFGIINMGVLLSFKQNLTQAASESARAGIAVALDTSDDTAANTAVEPFSDERYEVVDKALDDTIGDHGRSCGQPVEWSATPTSPDGMTCLRKIHDCADPNTDDYQLIVPDRTDGDCLTVRIVYDNRGSARLMPAFPIIAAMEPDKMSAQTTIRLVPVS